MAEYKPLTEPIIFTATRLESIANRYLFEPMGTSVASMRILRILKKHKKEMTPKEILMWSGGTKSNLSQRIGYLERCRFIERIYASFERDKRKVSIAITPAGILKLKEIDNRLHKAQVTLENFFSDKEMKMANKFFEKINKILDEHESMFSKIFKK